MKKRIVMRLLAGCLSAAMLTPSAVWAAEASPVVKAGTEPTAAVTEIEPEAEAKPETEAKPESDSLAVSEENKQPETDVLAGSGDEGQTQTANTKPEASLGESRTKTAQGWVKKDERWTYFYSDGTSPKEKFETIDQEKYYFDKDGWMVTGWQKIEDKWYYFDTSGKMLTGWQWVNGSCYFMDESGVMAADTWVGEYYVDPSGAWIPGKTKQNTNAGWVKSGNRWWYRHGDGSYTTSNWELIGGKWYYFDGSGWMMTGWQQIGGAWYYLEGSGAMLTGWQRLGGNWYYLNASGRMATGWQQIGGAWYYLNGSGAMLTGWQKIGGAWYYLNGSGAMMTGWQQIGGVWYYLNGSGAMLTGWQKIGGAWYYLNGSGAMLTGWQWIGGKCYFLKASGAMAANEWIDGFYVDGSGAWIPGKQPEVQAGWIQSGSRWWYRHNDGSYTTSNWETINGKKYYFDAAGWMQTGWLSLGGKWYYLNASGAMVTGWQEIGGKSYYLHESGEMAADTWIGDKYVDGSGAWVEGKKPTDAGWKQEGGRWYYVNPDGSRAKSTWKTIDGVEYYFDADGWMVTGWQKVGSSWYYLKSDGSKAYDYWVGTTGVGGYYVSKYGTMVAGQTYSYGNYIYTFDANGLCTGKEDRYVKVQDKNGRTYKVEKQFQTDPQVGVDVTEDEFLAAAVYAEAGNQKMPGMTGVALVMLNRMNTYRESASPYPSQANIMIYQAGQFEVARNGALTRYLKNINSSILNDAKEAVKRARAILDAYNNNGTPRTVEGLTMPEGKTDFNYMGFMTPKAFENAGLDWEKTDAFTHMNTTFYTTWIKKK